MTRRGFCIFINTFFQGPVPSVLGEENRPVVFGTRLEAEREIAEFAMIRLQQFLDGERDFEDAMTVEEYIVAVDVLPDGSILDEDGNHFDKCG
jgi:hypothetical protein